jgi:hypothetical protein
MGIARRLVKVSDNNRRELASVILQQKFWLKNSLSQSVGGATGRWRDRVEKQAVEGTDPKWRPVVSPVPNYTLPPFSRLTAFTTTTTLHSR